MTWILVTKINMETLRLPNKSVFKKDEVCSITGVKPYVLGFWEAEFAEINPTLSQSGVKLYEQSDIEAIVLIKNLLFEDKLTIEKAKVELTRLCEARKQSTSETKQAEEAMFTRRLVGHDIQKLVMAKEKLSRVIGLTKGIQERHNWSNL